MKKQLTKILSVVLSIAVVLSVCGVLGVFNATASDTEKVTDYYVGYGGTGDGSSLDNMAPTVAKAIKTINSNGLVAGDTANIWIVQDIEAIEKTSETAPAHNLAAWGGTVNHTAKIVVKPYASNQSKNASIPTYLAMATKVGAIDQLAIGGPTEIDGLELIHCSNQYGFTYRFVITANGFDLTIGSAVTYSLFSYTSSTAANWAGSTWDTAKSAFPDLAVQNNVPITIIDNVGGKTPEEAAVFENPITLTLRKEVSYAGYTFDLSGFNPGFVNFKEDVTFVYDTNSYRPYAQLGCTRAGDGIVTYEKNFNVKLPVATKIGFSAGARNVVVKGGLQLITNDNVLHGFNADDYPFSNFVSKAYTDDTFTTNSNYWILETAEANTKRIDFISGVTGKFAVADSYIATATHTDGTTKVSENGILDLSAKPGEYTVDFEKVAAKIFDYYVKAGGTGDGTSIEDAAPSVAAAITTMNSLKLNENDTANIWIVQDIAALQKNANDKYHNLALWGGAVEHAAKIVIKPHADNQKVNTAITSTYLAFGAQYTDQDKLILGGPTEFEDVTLLYMSRSNFNNNQSIIITNGNYAKFNNGVVFGNIAVNGLDDWSAYTPTVNTYSVGFPVALAADGTTTPFTKPVTLICENNLSFGGNHVNIPAFGAGTYVFNEDVTIVATGVGNNRIYFSLGPKSTTTPIEYKKNLNFKFDGTIRFENNSSVKSVVSGGLQIIVSDKATLDIDSFTLDNLKNACIKDSTTPADTWELKVSRDDINNVNFIDGITGKFTAVKEGYKAVAFKDGKLVKTADENGVIDLSAETGAYEIQFLKEVEYDFDKDFDFDKDDCAIVQAKLLSDSTDAIYDVNGDNLVNICDLVALNEKLA